VPLALSLAADSRFGSVAWSVSSQPVGSIAWVRDASLPAASFTPDRAGTYTLVATGTDLVGRTAEATIVLTAITDCTQLPPSMDVLQGESATLPSRNADPACIDAIVAYRWSLSAAPNGSTLSFPQSERYVRIDRPGVYGLSYVATPRDGATTEPRTFEIHSADCTPVPSCVTLQQPQLGLRGGSSYDEGSRRTSFRLDATSPCGRVIASVSLGTASAAQGVELTYSAESTPPPGLITAVLRDSDNRGGLVTLSCRATDALGLVGETSIDAPIISPAPEHGSSPISGGGNALVMLADDAPLVIGKDQQLGLSEYKLDRSIGQWVRAPVDPPSATTLQKGLRVSAAAFNGNIEVAYQTQATAAAPASELRYAKRDSSGGWTVRPNAIVTGLPPTSGTIRFGSVVMLISADGNTRHVVFSTADGNASPTQNKILHYSCTSACAAAGPWTADPVPVATSSPLFHAFLATDNTIYIGYRQVTTNDMHMLACTGAICSGKTPSAAIAPDNDYQSYDISFALDPLTQKPGFVFASNNEYLLLFKRCTGNCGDAAQWSAFENVGGGGVSNAATLFYQVDGTPWTVEQYGGKVRKRTLSGWVTVPMDSAPYTNSNYNGFQDTTVVPSSTGGLRVYSQYYGYWEWEP